MTEHFTDGLDGHTVGNGAFVVNVWRLIMRAIPMRVSEVDRSTLPAATKKCSMIYKPSFRVAYFGGNIAKKDSLKAVFKSFVGITGFEPATPNSRSWCANRTALHPENDVY